MVYPALFGYEKRVRRNLLQLVERKTIPPMHGPRVLKFNGVVFAAIQQPDVVVSPGRHINGRSNIELAVY
jgi:hypothetical protein